MCVFDNKDPRDLVVLYTRATLLARNIKSANLMSALLYISPTHLVFDP